MKILIVVLLILFGLLQYRLWVGEGNVHELRHYQQRIEQLRHEAERRHQRNQALQAEVNDLKKGLEAVEERARQDLGMIKEGETFFQVIEPPDRSVTDSP